MVSIRTFVFAVVGAAVGLGCDADVTDDLDPAEPEVVIPRRADAPPSSICSNEPDPNPTFHDPPYDCTESVDLGYDAGNPFDITVVHVDGKPVEKDTANAFWVMREAAKADGVDIHINSGFRTMADQEYFWMCYQCCCCNSCNLAAQPGYSNHQSGHALDLSTSTPGVYDWLVAHGAEFGFSKTVPSENWHWEWWGGGPGGGICDIASPPVGYLDSTTCEAVGGWAQDPDTPDGAVNVSVVFDGAPGEPQALEFPVVADQPRDDLCEALGSCNHAFEVSLPIGLRDSMPHSVRVFATDTEGGEGAELAQSPGEVVCGPPALSGIRRRVPDAGAFETWGFSTLYDEAVVDATTLASLDEGVELGVAPFLVTAEVGEEIWLVDKGYRRPIADAAVAAAWRFDLSEVQALTDAQLADIPIGTPLRDVPRLATVDGIEHWLVDDPQSGLPGGGGSAGGSAGGGDAGGDGGGDATGGDTEGESLPGVGEEDPGACTCRARGERERATWMLGLFVLAAIRRRSSRA